MSKPADAGETGNRKKGDGAEGRFPAPWELCLGIW